MRQAIKTPLHFRGEAFDCFEKKCNHERQAAACVLIPMAVTTLNLPATLSSFDCSLLSRLTSLTNITVDEGNPYYKSAGNMLLSKDGTQLYYYYGNDATLNIPQRTAHRQTCARPVYQERKEGRDQIEGDYFPTIKAALTDAET